MTFDDDPDAEEQSGTSLGTSEESEQVLMALERISASCSPLPMSASAFGALSGSSNMGTKIFGSRIWFFKIITLKLFLKQDRRILLNPIKDP